jgi:hypothetical protein
MKVNEIYVSDSDVVDSKNILLVYDDGHLELKWCYEDYVEKQENPSLVKVGRSMKLEYGEANLFGTRQMLPFQDEQGKLEKMWEKIL